MSKTTNITLYAPSVSNSGGSTPNYALTYRAFDGVPLSKIIAPDALTGYSAGLLYQFAPGTLIVFSATGTKSDNTTESTWIGFRVLESINDFASNIVINSSDVTEYDSYFVGNIRGNFEIPFIYPDDGTIDFSNAKLFNDTTQYNLLCNLRKALTTSGSPIHTCATIDNVSTITVPIANVYKGGTTSKYTSFAVNLNNFRLGYDSANDVNKQAMEGIWINRV